MTTEVDNSITVKKEGVWGFWSTAGFGLALLVISLIVQGIIAVIFVVVSIFNNRTTDFSELDYSEFLNIIDLGMLISLSIIISAIISIGILLLFIRARRGAPAAEYLGLRSFSIKATLVGLPIIILYIVSYSLIYNLFDTTAETDVMLDVYATTASPVLLWLAVVVFAPVFEEILFRGFLYTGFRSSRIGVVGAVIITSLLWAGSHLQYQLFGIILIFILGIILGIVRQKTGSLWVPMIMHGFNNLLAMILLALDINI